MPETVCPQKVENRGLWTKGVIVQKCLNQVSLDLYIFNLDHSVLPFRVWTFKPRAKAWNAREGALGQLASGHTKSKAIPGQKAIFVVHTLCMSSSVSCGMHFLSY